MAAKPLILDAQSRLRLRQAGHFSRETPFSGGEVKASACQSWRGSGLTPPLGSLPPTGFRTRRSRKCGLEAGLGEVIAHTWRNQPAPAKVRARGPWKSTFLACLSSHVPWRPPSSSLLSLAAGSAKARLSTRRPNGLGAAMAAGLGSWSPGYRAFSSPVTWTSASAWRRPTACSTNTETTCMVQKRYQPRGGRAWGRREGWQAGSLYTHARGWQLEWRWGGVSSPLCPLRPPPARSRLPTLTRSCAYMFALWAFFPHH